MIESWSTQRSGLWGRDAELAHIASVHADVAAGRGSATAFVGDPGLGKTRMLGRILAVPRPAETMLVHGCGDEQPMLRHGSVMRAVTWPDAAEAVLAHLASGPATMVLDDAHLLAEELVSTVDRLLGMTTFGPLLLALAYRPRQLRAPMAAVIARAAAGDVIRLCRLEPLTLVDARALVGDRPELADIHAEADANPLYLQVLVDPAEPALNAVVGELARLEPGDLRVLRAAAVLGDELAPDLLEAVLTTEQDEADGGPVSVAAVDRLVAHDLIRSSQTSTRLRFRHPVVRRVVYDRIDVSERLALHRRADAHLAAQGASAVRRSPHIAAAPDPGDPSHVTALIAGARTILTTDPRTAAVWLTTAGALAGESDPRFFDISLLLARAKLLTGDAHDGRDVLHTLWSLAHTASPAQRTSATVHSGRASRMLGQNEQAAALLRLGLSTAADDVSHEAVVLHTEVADLALEAADFPTAVHHAALAADLAHRAGDRAAEAAALGIRAMAQIQDDRPDLARLTVAAATLVLDVLPDAGLVHNFAGLHLVGMSACAVEDFETARRLLTRGLALARRTGEAPIRRNILKTLAEVHRRLGNLDDALAHAQEARDGHGSHVGASLAALAETLYADSWLWSRGVDATAEAVLLAERAVRTVEGSSWFPATIVRISVGEILIRAGEPERGSRLILAAAGGESLSRLPLWRRCRWAATLTIAAVAMDDLALAGRCGDLATASAVALPSPARQAYAAEARMYLAGARGDAAAALGWGDEAVGGFLDRGMRLDAGRALVAAARVSLDLGHVEGIERRLDHADELATRCGSTRLSLYVERQRGRLGRAGLTQLTERELQIATLVGQGISSKDVARALFLGVRTVESHLGRIYRKLGLSGRSELAQALGNVRTR